MDPAFETVQFLARSDSRLSVLTSLPTDASVTRAEIQRETGVPRSTVSRVLRELGARELVSVAGHRYEPTPLGAFLAGRLQSVFDSVEAIQRLQGMLGQLATTEPDLSLTGAVESEVLTATTADPGAPGRRFADLVHAASHVRLLVPAVIPLLFDGGSAVWDDTQTVDVIVPSSELEKEPDGPVPIPQRHDGTRPVALRLFAYDGAVPYLAGTVDETAVLGLTDGTGGVHGYLETNDASVYAWTRTVVDAYRQGAARVPI